MKLPNLTIHHEYIKVPTIFQSIETGKPFSNCISCEKALLENGVQYVIEKAIKNYKQFNTTDTIFEYAMCLQCYDEIQKTFSDTSKRRIESYFQNNVDFVQRRERFLKNEDLRIDEWISTCVVKGTAARDLTEYQIVCQCDGELMLYTYMPFMIGSEAMDEVAQLLSTQTLGEIDGLYDDFFGLSPELRDLLNPRLLVV
ncbi:MAG: hypothetical protein ACE5IR_13790 [bacterium]